LILIIIAQQKHDTPKQQKNDKKTIHTNCEIKQQKKPATKKTRTKPETTRQKNKNKTKTATKNKQQNAATKHTTEKLWKKE
jgi:hypothetical protein